MKYLFIDTATANLVVAIVINNEITYIHNKYAGREMSVQTLPIIKEAFAKSKIKPNQIDKIFVTIGPGSFTGIRIGLTIAKVMASSLKIPVIPISSLEVIASTNTSKTNTALIDARRGYVYAGTYDKDLNEIVTDSHILLEKVPKKTIFVSYDEIPNAIKPSIDVLKIIKKHENEEGINPHKLNPKYLKQTEAEEKLKNETNMF